jgi:hypothetical protein
VEEVAMVERLVGWFGWVLVEGNFGSLCSSSFSPAIVTNSQFTARDSFFARGSFVSFPKMFPLQKGREERERSQQEGDVGGGKGMDSYFFQLTTPWGCLARSCSFEMPVPSPDSKKPKSNDMFNF